VNLGLDNEKANMAKRASIKHHRNALKMKKKQEPRDKTVGTMAAEKARARANGFTDAKREDLLKRGLSIIYGGNGRAKAHAGRG
jgi:hypothetical protein